MTTEAPPTLTVAEFARLPETPGKTELVEGRVVQVTPVGPHHGEGAARLTRRLDAFAESNALGAVRVETGYRLPVNQATLRAPDVSFVTKERRALEQLIEGFVDGIPDLAVEVVSPSDSEAGLARKVQEYLDSGVARVWVVRPELRNVTVHRPGGDSHTYRGEDVLTSDDAGFTLPGFELALPDIFPA